MTFGTGRFGGWQAEEVYYVDAKTENLWATCLWSIWFSATMKRIKWSRHSWIISAGEMISK